MHICTHTYIHFLACENKPHHPCVLVSHVPNFYTLLHAIKKKGIVTVLTTMWTNQVKYLKQLGLCGDTYLQNAASTLFFFTSCYHHDDTYAQSYVGSPATSCSRGHSHGTGDRQGWWWCQRVGWLQQRIRWHGAIDFFTPWVHILSQIIESL